LNVRELSSHAFSKTFSVNLSGLMGGFVADTRKPLPRMVGRAVTGFVP
jgi:hypothetical protein